MRAALVVSLLALLLPAVASAQSPSSSSAPTAAPSPSAPPEAPSPGAAPSRRRGGGDVTRDEYIERAKESAAHRFDRMDTDHDGVLTGDERRAYRQSHRRGRNAEPEAAPAAPATSH